MGLLAIGWADGAGRPGRPNSDGHRNVPHRRRSLPLALLLLFATSAWAKLPDWLQPLVTEDVSALGRGAVAVRLLDAMDVQHLPDGRVKRVYRGAIRVNTDNGRKRAECGYDVNVDTERLMAARAWIVAPDGKTIESLGTSDFVDAVAQYGTHFWNQKRVIGYRATKRMPIGGVFAWEFEVTSQEGIFDVSWVFPRDLPMLRGVFEVRPAAGGRLEWNHMSERIAPPIAGATPDALRWEVTRFVPAPAAEKPSGFLATLPLISVRSSSADGNLGVRTWADLAARAAEIVEPCIVISPELRAKAESIVAGKLARWDRVRALSEFVQKEITYLQIVVDKDYLAGYRPHPAPEVLQNRFGDCKDKATLLVALLRALGDSGQVVLVSSGDPKYVRADWPSTCFNHAIVGVRADEATPAAWPIIEAGSVGRLVLFDPTDSRTPLGCLPIADQAGLGLVISRESTGLVALPSSSAEINRHEWRVRAQLAENGDLSVSVEESSRGAVAVGLRSEREDLRPERYTPVLEAWLHETISIVEALQWKDTWQPETATWRLDYQFKAPRYGRKSAGNLLVLNPQILFSRLRLAAWKTRQEGVAWQAASTRNKSVRITLPEHAAIEELPDDWEQEIGSAKCRLRYLREGHDVILESEIVQAGGFFERADYEAIRGFFQKMHEAERRPVLIRLQGAPKT